MGIAAAALVASRPLLVSLTSVGYYEVLYALLIVAAVIALRQHAAYLTLALLLLAGGIRVEAWILAPLAVAVTFGTRSLRASAVMFGLCALPLVAWGITDLFLSGQAFGSITETREGAASLGRDRGLEAVWLGPLRLAQAATVEVAVLWCAAFAAVAAIREQRPSEARRFMELSAAALAIAAVSICASVAGASLLVRYFLASGILLGVATAVGFHLLMREGISRYKMGGTATATAACASVLVVVALIALRVGDLRALSGPDEHDWSSLSHLAEANVSSSCESVSVPALEAVPYVTIPSRVRATAVQPRTLRSGVWLETDTPLRAAGALRDRTPPTGFEQIDRSGRWTLWARPGDSCLRARRVG